MLYAFDNYRLDTDTHELTLDGLPVAVEPQTFRLLQILVEHRSTVLSKEDLIDAVWQGRFTSDAAIAGRVKNARKAVGDDGREQRLIKTIHGVGYRFVGTVRSDQGSGADSVPDPAEALPGDREDSRPTVLVTPFGLASGDADMSIVATGITHDVIVGLSRLRWLRVISWASAMQLQAGSDSLLRPLTAADYCLSANLVQRGRGLELAVELTDLRSTTVVWADRLAASSGDVNELRAAVVLQAVNALELQISTAEAAKAQYLHTEDLDAWSNYHLGLLHAYRFNARDNALATSYFERAIALQPDFSRAHAGLSFALFQSAFNRYPGTDERHCRDLAVRSAERSVQLDSQDPLANFVMGRSFWLAGDVASGQPWLERALLISGNFAQAHYAHGLATVMLDEGGSSAREGHREAESAISLSPLDPFMYGFYGVHALSYLRDGRLEEARFWSDRAARQPNAIVAMDFIAAAANAVAGQRENALHWAQRAKQRSPGANSELFFRSLPFAPGDLRQKMQAAFNDLGLAPKH